MASNTKIWDELYAKVGSLAELKVHVGVLESDGGGDAAEGGDMSIADLAAIHEFGAPAANIPERSFIRATFDNKRDEMDALCTKIAKAIILDRVGVEQGLGLLGVWAVAAIQKTIRDEETVGPEDQALKPATIRRKQRTEGGKVIALIDTSQLIQSLSWSIDGAE